MTTIQNYEEQETKLVNELKAKLINASVKSRVFKDGTITDCVGNTLETLCLHVQFPIGLKKLSFKVGFMQNKLNSFTDPEIQEVADTYYNEHKKLFEVMQAYEIEQKNKELEAAKQAEKEKELAAKQEERKKSVIKKFESFAKTTKSLNPTEEFYYNLGWLANHLTSITAKLPEYLEPAFIKYFGSDTEKTLVDSTRKTSGGYSMQWSWGFSARIKKSDNVPTALADLFKNKTVLNDTSYIWSIIQNYGFCFGKKQNLKQIRSYIPTEYTKAFDSGLAA